MPVVLLAIHDADVRDAITEQEDLLDGVSFREAPDGATAREAVTEAPPAVLVADAGLADESGAALCHDLRMAGLDAFMVLLGADNEAAEAAGADAALARPLRLGVLIPMLREAVSGGSADDAGFRVGGLMFHPGARRLETLDGDVIHVTEKEAAILVCLHDAGGTVVARETLLHEVWGYAPELDTHTLETHMYRLRQKVEPDPANATVLITEEGGYRLIPHPG